MKIMPAGYSGTPLAKKLGYKPGSEACLLGAPAGFRKLLDPLPAGVKFAARSGKSTDLVHVFTTARAELAHTLQGLRKTLKADAAIWVSWPKKSARSPPTSPKT